MSRAVVGWWGVWSMTAISAIIGTVCIFTSVRAFAHIAMSGAPDLVRALGLLLLIAFPPPCIAFPVFVYFSMKDD